MMVIVKEFKEINEGAIPRKLVIEYVHPSTLTVDKKRRAIYAVSKVKLKRDIAFKCRACEDRSKQSQYLGEYESIASPVVAMDSRLT